MSIEVEPPFRRSPDAEPWRLRLRDRDGNILGAGIALAGGAVLTCAHVVERAVGVEITVDRVGVPDAGPRQARIIPDGWVPELPGGGGDIALLETTEPGDLPRTPLSRLPSPRNRTVHASGFPKPHDFAVTASAVLAGEGGPANEWIQLDPAEHGIPVQAGFSGAGVVDDRSGAVVGMVVTTYRDAESRVSWLIPVDTLVKHVPAIAGSVGPDVPPDSWQPVFGLIVIVIGLPGAVGADAGPVVDAAGKSTAELSRALPPRSAHMSLGLAGIEQAQQPEEVLDDVVAPLVRDGATVVLQFADESSPSAELARQWQRAALKDRIDSFGDGVAELEGRERAARDHRRQIRTRLTVRPPLADIPALSAQLGLQLMALRASVGHWKPMKVARALRHYEPELVESLAAIAVAERENQEAVMTHERLRGLLISYNAKAVEHGLMEDEQLVDRYRAARTAVDARPCDLAGTEELVDAYVTEVRRRT